MRRVAEDPPLVLFELLLAARTTRGWAAVIAGEGGGSRSALRPDGTPGLSPEPFALCRPPHLERLFSQAGEGAGGHGVADLLHETEEEREVVEAEEPPGRGLADPQKVP